MAGQTPGGGAGIAEGLPQSLLQGLFRYADSYLDAALPWSIDPVNLPRSHDGEFVQSHLAMQTATGRRDIARATLLGDFLRFGFTSQQQAADHLDALLAHRTGIWPDIGVIQYRITAADGAPSKRKLPAAARQATAEQPGIACIMR